MSVHRSSPRTAPAAGASSRIEPPTRRRSLAETKVRVAPHLLARTFEQVRRCGNGRHECQVLWVGPWEQQGLVTDVVHPRHRASGGGFVIDSAWLTEFWRDLATRKHGVWAQVHTHPAEASHSDTDNDWPLVHLEGFRSLVIPNFGMGPVTLDETYLAQINAEGRFEEASVAEHITEIG